MEVRMSRDRPDPKGAVSRSAPSTSQKSMGRSPIRFSAPGPGTHPGVMMIAGAHSLICRFEQGFYPPLTWIEQVSHRVGLLSSANH